MKMTKDAAMIVAKVYNTLMQVSTSGTSSRLLVSCIDMLDQMQGAEILEEQTAEESK